MVAVRHLTAEAAQHQDNDILPAEMGRQGKHTSLPRRADTGEEVEAPVQAEPARRRAHGPQVPGEIRWL